MPALFATAYLALTCWAVANLLPRAQSRQWSRLVWTIGCLANLGHVLLAFHLLHGWSHSAASAAIAEQTYEQSGLDWNGGIYVNYAFCTFWLVDAGAWWLAPAWYERRPLWLDGLVQFVFLFMFFNATVVFGKSPFSGLGWVVCLAGVVGWVWNRCLGGDKVTR